MSLIIIGQKSLIGHLELRIDKRMHPRFMLLVGATGSGKRTIADWYALKLQHDYEVVTDQKVDSVRAVIESSLTLSRPKTYIFPDVQDMTLQAQNAFLKSLEEPSMNAHFLWTVNSEWNVLSTIRSRASMLHMDTYSREELAEFTEDGRLLDMCQTPGQIIHFQSFEYDEFIEHCEKVVDALGRINIGNIFNILKHIKEQHYELVIPTLQYVYKQKLSPVSVQSILRQLKVLQETSIVLEHNSSVNVRNALETMFLKLWEVA